LSVALEAKYDIMSISAHSFYFQTAQEALHSCSIILEKYGSDDCNIGEWRSWWVKYFEASKKLITFNDISHLLFSLLGASDMHLNMPYLYFCVIDVQ